MSKNTDTNNERFARDLNSRPKERYVGQWQSGRLYPLYNVVVNNGTKFLSLNGKMKEEPYVIYNKDKETFSANDGWEIREMSADSRITAMGGGGGGGVTPEQVQDMIAGKQDVISDLATIRSGAAAGASAYKKPNGGIPKSDLSSAVKASLDNADLVGTKQDTLVSGENIKTVGGQSILGSGDIPIQPGDTNAVKYVSQDLTDAQKAQARANIDAASLEDIQGEPGVGFASIFTPQPYDGTMIIVLSNNDTITVDLNHNHPQYLKYVMLNSESDMPASPDSTTLYMWPEE